MTSSDKIHIVFACDDNYAQHAGVAITSLKEQQKSGLPVHVHVLDGGISPVNLDKLKELKDGHLDITVHQGNIEEYTQYLVATCVSIAAYLRLSVERILPPEINRIIYCDCDVIFLKPIDELWNTDLGGQWLAAVRDLPHINNKDHWKNLGLEKPEQYFNSGIILVDLNAWRSHQVSESVKNFLKSNWNKVLFWDQDGLNAVLYKNWLPLDVTWNTITCTVHRKKMPDPHIIHYATGFKPWFYKSLDPFREEYIKYLRLSPWRNYQFPDKNLWVWTYRKILLNTPEGLLRVVVFFTSRLRNFIDVCARLIALIKISRKHP